MTEPGRAIDTAPAARAPTCPTPPGTQPRARHASPGPGHALLVVLIYVVLVPLVLGLVLSLAWMALHAHAPAHGMAIPGVRAVLGLLCVLGACATSLLYVRGRWPDAWSRGTLDGIGLRRCRAGALVQGIALGLAAQWAGMAAAVALNGPHPPRQDIMQTLYALPPGAAWLAVPALLTLLVVLVPFTEEVVFRGVLMSGLSRRMPVPLLIRHPKD